MEKKDKKAAKELLKRSEELGKPAILFNFDGTVMHTEPAVLATYRELFSKYDRGNEFTRETEHEVLGTQLDTILRKYFPGKNTEKLVDEYRSYQSAHLRNLIQPTKGAKDFLKWLKQEGYRTGVISTRDRASIVEQLQHTDMLQYMDVIIGLDYTKNEDLDPDNMLKACMLLKTKCAIYIGGSASDIKVAQTCGCFTIGFLSNRERTYELVEAGPDFLTSDFKQVRKLLEGEPLWIAYELLWPEELKLKIEKQEKAERKAEKLRKEKEKAEKKARKERKAAEKKEAEEKKAARKAEKKPDVKKTEKKKAEKAPEETKAEEKAPEEKKPAEKKPAEKKKAEKKPAAKKAPAKKPAGKTAE
ncbi:MAG: HAD family hydrolase [Solobacterium sp.]|nr:HAD family hydrolase [Solobacterium sp.]